MAFQSLTFQMLIVGQSLCNALPRASSRVFAASLSRNEKKIPCFDCNNPTLSSTSVPSSRLLTTSAALSRGEGGYSRKEVKRKYKGRLEYLNRPDPCEEEGVASAEDDLQEWQVRKRSSKLSFDKWCLRCRLTN